MMAGPAVVGSEVLAVGLYPRIPDAKAKVGVGMALGAGAAAFTVLEIRRRRVDREGRGSASLGPTVVTDPTGRRMPGVVMSGTW